jgi:hypothetical protein
MTISTIEKAARPFWKSLVILTWKWLPLLTICMVLPMQSAFTADSPQKPSDPCENYRRPRGTTDASSMSLAEMAARTASGDQSALMASSRGSAADYAVDLAAIEKLTPQGKFNLCWFAEFERNLRQLDRDLTTYQHAYKCQRNKDKLDQVDFQKQRVRFILKELPSFASSNLRNRGSNGFILFYMWEVRDFTNSGEFKKFKRWIPEIRQSLDDYANDEGLKPIMKQLADQGTCTGGGLSTFEFRVFLAGNDVLVGQSDLLKSMPACRLKGWGTDCRPLEKVLQEKGQDLYPVSGQYNTLKEAKDFYCRDLKKNEASVKVVPLTGGRDRTAKLDLNEAPVGISNAPDCSDWKPQ